MHLIGPSQLFRSPHGEFEQPTQFTLIVLCSSLTVATPLHPLKHVAPPPCPAGSAELLAPEELGYEGDVSQLVCYMLVCYVSNTDMVNVTQAMLERMTAIFVQFTLISLELAVVLE